MGDTLLAGYSFSHHDSEIPLKTVHPSTGPTLNSAVYQAFNVNGLSGQKYKLKKIVFYLKKVNTPTGYLKACLYNMAGNRMSDAKPTGSPLATSELVNIANLGDWYAINFVFVGSEQYLMTTDQEFCIAVLVASGLFGPDESVLVARGSTMVNGVLGWYSYGEWHHE